MVKPTQSWFFGAVCCVCSLLRGKCWCGSTRWLDQAENEDSWCDCTYWDDSAHLDICSMFWLSCPQLTTGGIVLFVSDHHVLPEKKEFGDSILSVVLFSLLKLPFNQCRVKKLCFVNTDALSYWAYSCIIMVLASLRRRQIWERIWYDELRERSIWAYFL